MDFGLPEKTLKYLKNLPALFPSIERVVIYGSRAKGTFKPGSDIDLALFGKDLRFDDISEVHAYLDGIPTIYKYDVLHYDKLNHENLKAHIDRVGKDIFNREQL